MRLFHHLHLHDEPAPDAPVRGGSEFMRHSVCWRCGGVKRLPSPNAFIYCDYCAALIDYDATLVVRQPQSGRQRAETRQLEATVKDAVRRNDRPAVLALKRQYFELLISIRPQSFPHRIGDPAFRAQFIEYSAQAGVVMDLDPHMQELQAQEGTASIGYFSSNGEPEHLWPLIDCRVEEHRYASHLWAQAGLIDLDPDHSPEDVRARLTLTGYVQNWIPRLFPDVAEALLARTGLTNAYVHVDPVVDGAPRHCGACVHEFVTLPGAKAALCDACGHELDLSAPEIACSNCGGYVTAPVGVTRLNCPHCKAIMERVHF